MKLKVYTYCSYKFSPVGFRHGVFEFDTDNYTDEYIVPVTDSATSSVVRNCFVEGLVQKAVGKIPETNEYIILLKGLECDYVNEDGMPAKKYGNFAFSTANKETYINLKNYLDSLSVTQLSEAMNFFLIPDSDAGDTAIKIDVKRFTDFITGKSKGSSLSDDTGEFNIIPVSYSDKTAQTLSERFTEYSVLQTNFAYQLKKKTKYLNSNIIVLIITAILIILMIIIIILLLEK